MSEGGKIAITKTGDEMEARSMQSKAEVLVVTAAGVLEMLGKIKQIFVGVRQILNSGVQTARMPRKIERHDKSHLLGLMQRRYTGANCRQSVQRGLPVAASITLHPAELASLSGEWGTLPLLSLFGKVSRR